MNKKSNLSTSVASKSLLMLMIVTMLMIGSAGSALAQQSASESRITMRVDDKSLSEALKELDGKSPLSIIFNVDQLTEYKSVSVDAKNLNVLQVIEILLKGTKLTYKLKGNTIVITPIAEKQNKKGDITFTVVDRKSKKPIADATCFVQEYNLYGVTDKDGVTVIKDVPVGNITISVEYLGYMTYEQQLTLSGDKYMDISMVLESLKVDDVTVVAEQQSFGKSNTSKISRQAIDHIQATSLADVLTLLPGSRFGGVDDMTSPQQATIRSISYNKNNSNGVSIIVDGVPMSNNAELTDNAYNVLGGGIDMRRISTDNIESVEVVTGVASAEHGDLSTGAIIVNSKKGETPLSVRGKVNPSVYQMSMDKGWRIGEAGGTLNASFDYLKSSGDPRLKRESYDRVNGRLAYSLSKGIYNSSTSFTYSGSFDTTGDDPDLVAAATFTDNKSYSLSLSHRGTFNINKLFSKSLSYTVGLSRSETDYYTTRYVVNSGGETPLLTSKENGIFAPTIVPPSYYTGGGSISEPLSLYAKIRNNFFLVHGGTRHVFNMGVEYRYEYNSGIGKYNDDDLLPLYNSDTRSVPFNEDPPLEQLSAYLEDNITTKILNIPVKVQAGVRFSSIQPFSEDFQWAVSPRINVGLAPAEWVDVRLAYGTSSKVPGTTYLYPEDKYVDMIIANQLDASGNPFLRYQTYVITPDNTSLKNSTTRRMELGLDFKLKNGRKLSLTAYNDKNTTGFGGASQYIALDFNYYNVVTDGNNNLMLDMTNIINTDRVLTTDGSYANTQGSENSGVEINFDFGRVDAIRTNFYLRGAYQQSKAYTTGLSHSNPVGYSGNTLLSPVKFVYSTDNTIDVARMFSTQFQAVCHIPVLELVASATMQVVWYNYSYTQNTLRVPTAYMDSDLVYHDITSAMLADPDYEIAGFSLADQVREVTIDEPTTQKPVWMINARLTKNITEYFGVSFYANNVNYYEPWQSSSVSSSESQRNTGTFAFGLELRLTLR